MWARLSQNGRIQSPDVAGRRYSLTLPEVHRLTDSTSNVAPSFAKLQCEDEQPAHVRDERGTLNETTLRSCRPKQRVDAVRSSCGDFTAPMKQRIQWCVSSRHMQKILGRVRGRAAGSTGASRNAGYSSDICVGCARPRLPTRTALTPRFRDSWQSRQFRAHSLLYGIRVCP